MYRENIFLYDVTQITTNLNGHHSSEILDVKKKGERKEEKKEKKKKKKKKALIDPRLTLYILQQTE